MGVARNTVINVAGGGVSILVTLATVPAYLSVIGLERYGVLALAWMLLGYFGLFSFGLGRATSHKIAQLANASPSERNEVFWAALWLNMLFGLLGAVLLLPVGYFAFDMISDLTSPMSMEARQVLPWIAISVPVATVSGVFVGALQGRERFVEINVIGSAGSVLMSVLPLIVALFHGPELKWLVAASLASRVLTSALLFYCCRFSVPALRPCLPRLALSRELLSFGGWITVANVVTPLLATFDRFIIASTIGAAAVSQYIIPFNLLSRIWILPDGLTNTLFPKFSLSGGGSQTAVLKLKSMRALMLVLTPLVLVGISAIEPFLILWVGFNVSTYSAPVAHMLFFGFWINSLARLPYVSLQAQGRPDEIAILSLIEVPPYALALFLGLYWAGIKGAAIVWTIRVALDAIILFALDRNLRVAILLFSVPALLIAMATVTVVSFSVDSASRWILLGGVNSLVLVWWVISVPKVWRELTWRRIASMYRQREEVADRSK